MDVESGQLGQPSRPRPTRPNPLTLTPEDTVLQDEDLPPLPQADTEESMQSMQSVSSSSGRRPARLSVLTPQSSSASAEESDGQGMDSRRSSAGWNSLFAPTPSARRPRSRSVVMDSTPLLGLKEFFLLPVEDSVYSYFMFITPVDQRRTKKAVTPLIFFAILLVAINFLMQLTLLTVVGAHIMKGHNEWMSSMVHVKNFAWYHLVPMPYNYAPPTCLGKDDSLCRHTGDGISCSPPSIQVLSDWDLLDTDGDGVWSKEEAQNVDLQETVQCDFGVDILSLYHNVARQMNASHVLKGRRNTDLFSGIGIHKAYFDWYMHKPLICQYGDPDLCGTLFQRGVFDEALLQQALPEFGDVSRALTYCNHLLRYECDKIMPSTFMVWRSRTEKQCGEKVYGQSLYAAPDIQGDSDPVVSSSVSMLSVRFKTQETYEHTKSIPFRLFLWVLLITFLSVMFLEIRSIFKVLAWSWTFPKDTNAGRDGNIVGRDAVVIEVPGKDDKEGSDDDHHNHHPQDSAKSIHAVRTDHRVAVIIVTVLRVLLWVLLLWSGIMFLTGQPRYLNLIFDALSLVFIFEIDELLYKTMLRYEFKEDHFSIDPIRVKHPEGYNVSGRKAVLYDILMFLGIILFGSCIVYSYCNVELNPVIDALACLCSKEGPNCQDLQQFGKPWWDNYWSATLPAANLIIDRLKEI